MHAYSQDSRSIDDGRGKRRLRETGWGSDRSGSRSGASPSIWRTCSQSCGVVDRGRRRVGSEPSRPFWTGYRVKSPYVDQRIAEPVGIVAPVGKQCPGLRDRGGILDSVYLVRPMRDATSQPACQSGSSTTISAANGIGFCNNNRDILLFN